MRSLWFAIVLGATACQGAKQTGPAWPAPSTTAEDGGESIAPHEASIAAAVEKSGDDDKDEPVAAAEAAEPAKATATSDAADKPATVSPPTQPTIDEVIISDEILIEIEDD